MANINPNDSVNKINTNINKEKKVNKKKEAIAQTKQVEASSLNALNSYGKASINFKGNIKEPTPLTQEVIDSRIKSLSDKFVSRSIAEEVALYNDIQYSRFEALMDKGIEYIWAKDVTLYNDAQYSRFKALMDNGVNDAYVAKEVALYNDTQYSRFNDLLKKGINQNIAFDVALYDDTQYSQFESLIDKGIIDSSVLELMKEENANLEKQVLEYISNNDTRGYKITVAKQQTTNEGKLTLIKESKTKDTEIKIEKNIFLDSNIEYSERKETYKDGTIHTYKKGGGRILDITKNSNEELINQIEILNNTNGEPYEIIHTTASDKLEGAFETIKYTLSDYPEDMDILKAIQDGTITGGEKLSTVIKNSDGSTSYKESYKHNNCLTTRNYNILKDENGKKLSESYKYSIKEKNGNILLNIDRSFTQNLNGSTETIVNGKKYIATFDDENMIATIKDSNGNETKIDFAEKFKKAEKDEEEEKNILGLFEENSDENINNRKELWKFFKECPADTLLTMKNISAIKKVDPLDSGYYRNEVDDLLKTSANQCVINHELGHLIDIVNNSFEYSSDPKITKAYNEEMALLKKQYPTEIESFIKYFGQEGGGTCDIGLNELFAETNMLLHNYGNEIETVKTRAMILTKYFPKTIAQIGQLLYGQKQEPTH